MPDWVRAIIQAAAGLTFVVVLLTGPRYLPAWLVLALAVLVIIAGTYVAYRIERPQKLRKYRFKMGLCVCCGYNLRGNASRVCPECGTPRVRMPP